MVTNPRVLLISIILISFFSICNAEDFWIRTNFHTEPYSMASDIFYTSQNEIYVNSYDSVYISLDFGNTWRVIKLNDAIWNNMLYSDDTDNLLYYYSYCRDTLGIFMAQKNSPDLSLVFDSGIRGISHIIEYENNYFALNWGQIRIFNTDWSENNLVLDENDEEEITCFAVDSLGTYYAGSTDYFNLGQPGGVYKSYDKGETWTYPDLPNHFVRAMAVDSEGRIFVGTCGHYSNGTGLIYRSIDNGNTWQIVADGTYVFSMAINSDDEIFVGLDADGGSPGVLYSEDNGDNWTLLNSEFPGGDVNDIAISPDGYVYLATQIGVYKSINSTTGIEENSHNTVNNFELFQNYPNPFNNETVLSFNLSKICRVQLNIYNLKGELVRNLIDEKKSKGYYSIIFNADNLKSGVYYYSLKVDNKAVSAKKMLYIR